MADRLAALEGFDQPEFVALANETEAPRGAARFVDDAGLTAGIDQGETTMKRPGCLTDVAMPESLQAREFTPIRGNRPITG